MCPKRQLEALGLPHQQSTGEGAIAQAAAEEKARASPLKGGKNSGGAKVHAADDTLMEALGLPDQKGTEEGAKNSGSDGGAGGRSKPSWS